ncbi:uncharacterized protein FPRO_02154 [Fusarium proliferatum ET1]|uniref:Related to permease of the major facilitator superfamily n=1 Tax=Fusarium proliferatum (strain ET1) TaxID=1227346 RepID=A0A1L7V3D1_FUSPR|nr:uncharacterized protein FPRO_02154 [Fusarium proliferatum ET1]CZR31609.1 related to permease of the major facilitator superfamily [Fusarium proliferatum ET1]
MSSKEGLAESHPAGDFTTQPVKRYRWYHLFGKDVSHVPVDEGYSTGSDTASLHSEIVNSHHNVFAAPEAVDIYKIVDGFEGAHRFEPSATWESQEEEKLVRRLDWFIALPACIMFFALQLDRGNIVQALSDGMLNDLGLTTNDYNNGMTIFYCSFLFAELPSQVIGKKLGPDVWIPIQMVLWSVVAMSQAALQGKTSFFICRWLLGMLEGGFIPDTILYLSYFYKNVELPRRLTYGILHLRGHSGLHEGWRYLFVIEGSFTALIGILTFFYLPPSPTQTSRTDWKGLLRPRSGWFSEREEIIMVTRVLRDDPGKATMHNRQGLTGSLIWEALSDYHMWPIYLIGLSWGIPNAPPQAYITLTCKALGFDTFHTNLLTIPAYTLFIIQLLFWTWVSERINQRVLLGVIGQLWSLPLLVSLAVLPPVFPGWKWAKWTLSTLLVGAPYPHAILVALTSRNAGSVRTRTVGSSLYNMSVQMSSIISSQIYRKNDAPYYYTGNKALLGVLGYNILIYIFIKLYYVRENNKRDKIWEGMTREEGINYLKTTTDQGNKRLDFRFAS